MEAIPVLLVGGVLCCIIAQSQQYSPIDDEPAVIRAAVNGDLDRLESLFERRSDSVNHRDSALWTPLFHAVAQNDEKMVKLTIQYGADINTRERKNGFTPLHLAIHKNFSRIAGELITNNASVNSVSDSGDSILHTASEKAGAEIMNLLIRFGADVNKTNNDEQTPLHRAASMGGVPAAELLINANVNINQVDQNEQTPLYLAIMNRNSLNMIELLINKGANVNYPRKSDGMTPLTGLIVNGGAYPELMEFLIRHGADVNHADQTGKTALHNAAHLGNVKAMELLINAGADVNAQDNQWNTPLHISAGGSSDVFYTITELLVNSDADIYAKNAYDETPLDVARSGRIRTFLKDKRTWYGWLGSIW